MVLVNLIAAVLVAAFPNLYGVMHGRYASEGNQERSGIFGTCDPCLSSWYDGSRGCSSQGAGTVDIRRQDLRAYDLGSDGILPDLLRSGRRGEKLAEGGRLCSGRNSNAAEPHGAVSSWDAEQDGSHRNRVVENWGAVTGKLSAVYQTALGNGSLWAVSLLPVAYISFEVWRIEHRWGS